MKLLLALALTLSFGSCVSTPPDMLATDGALGRQVQRVIARHDDYVLADGALDLRVADEALAQSAALEALVGLPAIARSSLGAALAPVAGRHDAYVRADPQLDELERETFLASTDGLLRLANLK